MRTPGRTNRPHNSAFICKYPCLHHPATGTSLHEMLCRLLKQIGASMANESSAAGRQVPLASWQRFHTRHNATVSRGVKATNLSGKCDSRYATRNPFDGINDDCPSTTPDAGRCVCSGHSSFDCSSYRWLSIPRRFCPRVLFCKRGAGERKHVLQRERGIKETQTEQFVRFSPGFVAKRYAQCGAHGLWIWSPLTRCQTSRIRSKLALPQV